MSIEQSFEGLGQNAERAIKDALQGGTYGRIPVTRTRTRHALAVRVRGFIIGAAQSLTMSQSATNVDVFEINPLSEGLPNHVAHGAVTSRTLQLARMDLYQDIMEEVLGDGEWIHLGQTIPNLSLDEIWKPPGSLLGQKTLYRYSGIIIDSIDRATQVDNAQVQVNVSLRWSRREVIRNRLAGALSF